MLGDEPRKLEVVFSGTVLTYLPRSELALVHAFTITSVRQSLPNRRSGPLRREKALLLHLFHDSGEREILVDVEELNGWSPGLPVLGGRAFPRRNSSLMVTPLHDLQ